MNRSQEIVMSAKMAERFGYALFLVVMLALIGGGAALFGGDADTDEDEAAIREDEMRDYRRDAALDAWGNR